MCSGKLLDNKALNSLFSRVGLILGLVMFMMVAFSFVKVLIDPDSFNDKQKGIPSIIKRVIMVIVMLGISSYVFSLLTNIQATILNNNVISKIVFPNSSSVNTDAFGNVLSSQLFLTFYTVRDIEVSDDADAQSKWCADNVNDVLGTEIALTGDFSIGYDCLDAYGDIEDYSGEGTGKDFIVDFNYVFCTIVGIVVCYLLLTYCVSVGIRIVQLAVLQIISPMAIVSYLSPKQDNMFSKWTKIYISTYIDVFIRIAIINFVVYLSGLVIDSWDEGNSAFWTSVGSPEGFDKAIIGILMIIALLSFAKKAPDLIKQLIPQSASGIGFGLGNSGVSALFGAGVGATVGAIGGFAAGKGVVGKATGLLGGIGTGAFRGGKSGFGAKGLGSAISGSTSAQAKANLAKAQRIASGATFGERVGDSVRGTIGMMSGYDKLNQELSMSNSIKSTLKDEDVIKHIQEVRQSYIQACASKGEQADAQTLIKFDNAEKEALRQMYAFSHDNDSGSCFININDDTIGLSINEEYSSNAGIYNQIKTNEARVGKIMTTYDAKDVKIYDGSGRVIKDVSADQNNNWKSDNTNIKTKIANKHKSGK